MTLVDLALRRPVTILVAILAIMLVAGSALMRMPRDIFPSLGVPVIYVAQPYGGMTPAQMEGFLTYYYEYHFLYITGIEHVESKSIQGVSLIKLQFHPGTDMAQALAETVNYSNRARAFMPPGTVPPFVMRFDAGSVPVGNLVFTSTSRSVGELQDMALNRVRPLFATLPGVSAPPPFGASQRTILVTVNPERLRAYNMAIDEIVEAVAAANTISPSGNARIGDRLPMVPVNSVVRDFKELEKVPLRTTGAPVFLSDVASVDNGTDIATGFALVNGKRTVYIPVTKRADASTMAVVGLVKHNLGKFQSVLPGDVTVTYEFDQSPYVTRAISALLLEGVLGAALTGLMVLLFLHDLRSTLVVVLNIPLAVLAALAALWLGGQSVNLMTLGGLSLAIGVLVDMSTVVIENIHARRLPGVPMAQVVAQAVHEVSGPLLLAMLCVLAVFVPSFFMTGVARALFVPLSLAVGFAMIASFLLSVTLVPILISVLLKPSTTAVHATMFPRLQDAYAWVIGRLMPVRLPLVVAYLALSAWLVVSIGRDLGAEIFPRVDVGQFQMRLRAPTGTIIERTEAYALRALDLVKREAGPEHVEVTLGFVGVQPPSYPVNTIHLWTSGPEEAALQISLVHDAHLDTEALKERMRRVLREEMPEVRCSFEASDIVSRVMSLGSATPITVDVTGPNLAASREYADRIKEFMTALPALRDVQIAQSTDYPTVEIGIDRQRAGMMGTNTSRVVKAVTAATSSSRYVSPNYWADPLTGVAYQIQVQVPQLRMDSLETIMDLPVSRRSGDTTLLRNVASVTPGTAVGEYDRYNMQRMVSVTANLHGIDLGHASAQIDAALKAAGEPPEKVTVIVRGQVTPMRDLFAGLQSGLVVAIVAVFLLLLATFQSLRLTVTVIAVVPAVIVGVVAALSLSGTTLNVQSYMGAIMAIGVAVANAILLVSFAERGRQAGATSQAAAIAGGRSRLRPILMTSCAMIAGMVPMALGMGDGGEQTAPLGRAVIGGLVAATFTTLFILPAMFALIRGRQPQATGPLTTSTPPVG